MMCDHVTSWRKDPLFLVASRKLGKRKRGSRSAAAIAARTERGYLKRTRTAGGTACVQSNHVDSRGTGTDGSGHPAVERTSTAARTSFFGTLWYAVVRSSRVRAFLEYMAKHSLNFGRAPDPSGDRGGARRWGLMAGSVACCTQYIRCSPLVPVQ